MEVRKLFDDALVDFAKQNDDFTVVLEDNHQKLNHMFFEGSLIPASNIADSFCSISESGIYQINIGIHKQRVKDYNLDKIASDVMNNFKHGTKIGDYIVSPPPSRSQRLHTDTHSVIAVSIHYKRRKKS